MNFVKRRRPWSAWLGASWLIGLTVFSLVASYARVLVPFVREYDEKVRIDGRSSSYGLGPGLTAWWGTDMNSFDVFSRCIYGARVTLVIGFGATVVSLILGGLVGIMSGYFRGWVDRLTSIWVDSLLVFPALLLAMLMVYRLDDLYAEYSWLSWANRTWSLTLTLGLLVSAPMARIVRAQTMGLREREFVLASRSLGASHKRVLGREIFPNLVPTIVTVAFTNLGAMVAALGALDFLGLGVRRPETWGRMISDSRTDIGNAWWALTFPCLLLFLTVIAFNFVGDELARRYDIREASI